MISSVSYSLLKFTPIFHLTHVLFSIIDNDDTPILHGAEFRNRAMKPQIIHRSLDVCWQIAHPAHRHHHLGGGELSAKVQRYLGGLEPGQLKLLLVLNLH